METRKLEQAKVHLLVLNSMPGKSELIQIAAASLSKEKLEEFYNEHLAPEPYDDPDTSTNPELADKKWRRVFKKDSPLQWYNPIGWNEDSGYHHEWVPVEQLPQAKAFYEMKGAIYLEE